MTTLVGTQRDLPDLLDALLELEFDAREAYKAAIRRIRDTTAKSQLRAFVGDHQRHARELEPFLEKLGRKPSRGRDIKQWLTKGKVAILGLAGDHAVLLAMKTNEDDANRGYERATSRTDLPADVRDILERNLADARRRRAWLEARLDPQAHASA